MWPPLNMQSLPSKEEIQIVKAEISTIELEIIETELRLDALRKLLSECRTWIALIRMIPPEILSLIFTEASKTDWKAPLVLQNVSRQWRDVAVGSPGVWMFIPLAKCSYGWLLELISLFLERSRNRPLHISVRDDSLLEYMGLLADRIECIHLKMESGLRNCYLQQGHMFHRLERLKIWHWDLAEDTPAANGPAAWDMLLFPNLKVLEINSISFSLLRAISAAPEFPTIRHLIIDCNGPGLLSGILTKCVTSLESVDLTFDTQQSEGLDMEHEVHFPHLKYLRLMDFSCEDEPRFRLKATTPILQAYLDDGHMSTLNAIKVDTGSVILLHVLRTPDLFEYPRLVTLCFGATHGQNEEFVRAIEWLSGDPALCPDLASIEYIGKLTQWQLKRASLALLTREKVTEQTIQLIKATFEMWEERTQKKHMHMFKELEPVCLFIIIVTSVLITGQCGDHMPCNFIDPEA